jgi:hypothetical protein
VPNADQVRASQAPAGASGTARLVPDRIPAMTGRIPPLAVSVACHAGYRGEETPRRFEMGSRSIEVAEVVDRWLAPDHRYFKVRGSDQATYVLRHDVAKDGWEVVLYRDHS